MSTSSSSVIDLVLEGKERDLGGFSVRRVLPAMTRRTVGPFVFFDHMGPATFPPEQGIDVRPHPHIALATVTYLFDGEILHRDSLGSVQRISPGDVNWMVAGKGIVHSERTAPDVRARGSELHGLQTWVGLPIEHEETEPSFVHHPADTLPRLNRDGVELRVVLGTAYGVRSPAAVLSPTLYVHAGFTAGSSLEVDDEHEERAVYVVRGKVTIEDRTFEPGTMVFLRPGTRVSVRVDESTDVMLAGGAPLDGPRHISWNFVASSKDKIERAKSDWREGKFPKVPGDDVEFIPLPEDS